MGWHALLQLLRALWHRLCGGLRRHASSAGGATGDRTERQQLLGPDATLSSAAGSPEPYPRPLVALSPPSPEPQLPCTIIVMRHGHRQDEEDSFWHQTAARPWDPPLSAKGKTQAAEAASKLVGLTVDYVISSPFKRCLQTSGGVVRRLSTPTPSGAAGEGAAGAAAAGGLPEGHWLVDWQFAEVCEPRVLFGMRSDARDLATSSDVEAWMWSGVRTDAALEKFAREDSRLQPLPMKPVQRHDRKPLSQHSGVVSSSSSSNRPVYPEDLEDGLGRYSNGFKEIARSFAGHTVLVVTHGECVRQAVLMAEPSSEVFEVQHTGYVVLKHTPPQPAQAPTLSLSQQRQQQQHSRRRSWQLLSGSGETGVLWLEDDDDDDDDD